jgi:glutamate-1-semialdehyde 2,1-aminomutase
MATGRSRVLVFDRCYHGTVDETLVIRGEDGGTLPRPGQIGRIHDPAATTVVVEFNDIDAVERALARGDIACLLAEPVMTNAGMVLPQTGFLEAVREACTRHDVLLAIDETHTLSSAPGGYARLHGLAADFIVCGKAIAGGVPCGIYGYTEAVAELIRAADLQRESGHSGIGTTLAANPLAIAALAASLAHLHITATYELMEARARQLASGIEFALRRHALPWWVSRVGARLPGATEVLRHGQLLVINAKTGSIRGRVSSNPFLLPEKQAGQCTQAGWIRQERDGISVHDIVTQPFVGTDLVRNNG